MDVKDLLGRPLRDVRISVTDRCNLRCSYCMPGDADPSFAASEDLLSFDEIVRAAEAFAGLGARKFRITGGEPLLRHELPALASRLAGIDGIDDLAITTNGLLLPRFAEALRSAGVMRVTVSLDSLDDAVLSRMSGRDVRAADVLAGIDAAQAAGFSEVKVNTVIQRGVNDGEAVSIVERFRGTGVALRFIEYMDVGCSNGWRRDQVVPSREIVDAIHARWPMAPVEPNYYGEVARRYAFKDGAGEVGFISSVTAPFCTNCTRARLASDGTLYTCLFATQGLPLRSMLRDRAAREYIAAAIADAWRARQDRYSELRTDGKKPMGKVEMYTVGG